MNPEFWHFVLVFRLEVGSWIRVGLGNVRYKCSTSTEWYYVLYWDTILKLDIGIRSLVERNICIYQAYIYRLTLDLIVKFLVGVKFEEKGMLISIFRILRENADHFVGGGTKEEGRYIPFSPKKETVK